MVQVPVVPDYLQGLTGDQRDIAVAVTNLFRMYGLESLAPKIISFVQAGMSAETISIELTQTPEYKQRFSANDARIKAGLPALSAAEYLATERAYRQVMQAAGLPIGFYDSSSDFTAWLANDVSPTEVKARVDAASEAINSAPAETLDYLKRWYGVGDLVAFALDSKRALPLIEQRISAAEAAATAGPRVSPWARISPNRSAAKGSRSPSSVRGSQPWARMPRRWASWPTSTGVRSRRTTW